MRRFKRKNLIFRVMSFCGGLGLVAAGLEAQLQTDKAVVLWTLFVSLFILGVWFCLLALDFTEQNLVTRWNLPAHRAGRVVSFLIGALLIVAVIIWAITGLFSGPPLVSVLLLFTMQIGGFVGIAVIGVLAAIGWIAKGNEETREWARSWGRTHGAAGASATQENAVPE